jgi:hypothetical protein
MAFSTDTNCRSCLTTVPFSVEETDSSERLQAKREVGLPFKSATKQKTKKPALRRYEVSSLE